MNPRCEQHPQVWRIFDFYMIPHQIQVDIHVPVMNGAKLCLTAPKLVKGLWEAQLNTIHLLEVCLGFTSLRSKLADEYIRIVTRGHAKQHIHLANDQFKFHQLIVSFSDSSVHKVSDFNKLVLGAVILFNLVLFNITRDNTKEIKHFAWMVKLADS